MFSKMDHYYDRASKDNYIEIADKCIDGIIVLWDKLVLDTNLHKGNIYFHKFSEFDVVSSTEYLYTMDYLSYVLSAYKQTHNEIYKYTFEKYINQFYEFVKINGPIYDDLPVIGQTLLFIKAFDILGKFPNQDFFEKLLLKYKDWLIDEKKHTFVNNHELFFDIALLHISVFMKSHSDAEKWQNYAVECINKMFSVAYYDDNTNSEHSLVYFSHNNMLYKKIIDFCDYYNIPGVEKIKESYCDLCETLNVFAHKDGSFPVIGDGSVFYGKGNNISEFFSDIGIAVIKHNQLYLTLKGKTAFQTHAHIDICSITARYKDIDFIIDSGHYDYDRYNPINRFLRSSAGHSSIFPLFVDNMFQNDFCENVSYSEITEYEHNENKSYIKSEYNIRDIKICRYISISENEILINDNWECNNPTTIRQRFIIPKELIQQSKFTVSKHILETSVNRTRFKFEIIPSTEKAVTEVQFGIASPMYYEYETSMLLDTYFENSTFGKIIARITFWEE